MAAADELFSEHGVDGVSNTEIAQRAGCSIGSFYRFFPNKEELVVEYVNRYLTALASNLPTLPDKIDFPQLVDVVSVLIDRSVAAYLQFPGFRQVRTWRYKDGRLASEITRNSELALITDLFYRSPYDLPSELVERMSVVIVDGTWPLLAGLVDIAPKDRPAMIAEIKFSVTSYIDARLKMELE